MSDPKTVDTESAGLLYNPDNEHEDECCSHCGRAYKLLSHQKERSKATWIIIWILLCALLINIGGLLLQLHRVPSGVQKDPSLQLYSPVNDLVEYVPHLFNRSRGEDKTKFQGWPTDEIDDNWASLYSPGMLSAIDAHTASLLPERTARLPLEGRENEYVMTLDIFHQMHCLDVVRMALYRDRYDKHFYFPNGTVDYCKWSHVDHCLDQVRQALICQADVSVVYFEWSEIVQGLRPRVDNQHTCRNFDKILDWAAEHTVSAHNWHPSKHVVEGHDGKLEIQKGGNHALPGQGECNAV
ncbi:hypothetical protein TsFJ059_002926 [Trichoderma semiorbis]|uniref:Cyclochlorotine biosynthesis protein O n=1 Tax=Trichoderma semiorbis TaxID=1491008 RepID=A0A9P8HNE7_9HYPO|nr:hypothetical protein TsFJ059_002926 [Trichoderma semiorbis]